MMISHPSHQLEAALAGSLTPRPNDAEMATRLQRLETLTRILAERKMEGLALYRPLPYLEAFHECRAKWRIIDGSNRASKTLTGCVEDARCWCGCDPYDKYPRNNGNGIVVALHQDSLSMLWRKCAEPGEFKVIPDEHTGEWRSVRPDPNNPLELDPYDIAYCEKWRDAPPLIPPRMVKAIAWDDKGKGVPRLVTFETNWRVLFRSSGGAARPDQGTEYHQAHLDEQIGGQDFYNEVHRGITQVKPDPKYIPCAYWTATGQVVDPNLLDLRERAEAGDEDVKAFQALIELNPFIPQAEKLRFFNGLSDEDRYVRYYGNNAIHGRSVYSRYQPMGVHGVDPFVIPDDWCIWVTLDPGRKHCATILAAVDPDEKHVWVYDGFDLQNAGAAKWAETLKTRLNGRRPHAIICDAHMGRQKSPAYKAEAQYYYEAMLALGVIPEVNGTLFGFFPGSDNVDAREAALQSWLEPRLAGVGMGTPKLKVVRGCVPELDRQVSRACSDDKNPKRRKRMPREDLLVCLEYLAAADPGYFPPEEPTPSVANFDIDDYLDRFRSGGSRPCRIG